MKTAPPKVTDRVAKLLVRTVERGGPDADAICVALTRKDFPRFGPQSYSRLMVGLQLAGRIDASLAVTTRGPDGQYRRKLEESRANGSTNPALRVLSVAKQIWVIMLFMLVGLGLLVTIPSVRSDPSLIPLLGAGLGVLVVLVIIIDAFKRRCRKCRKLLAGDVLSIVRTGSYTSYDMVTTTSGGTAQVDKEVHTHSTTWGCVHCGHRWTS
ncbi:MAG TPA: hypothetical protein VK034_09925 [Enhygromyxa sp.]|nr:hypothetical protein [Enhygromyxa sp.]